MKFIFSVPRIESEVLAVEPCTVLQIELSETEYLAALSLHKELLDRLPSLINQIMRQLDPLSDPRETRQH